MLILQLKNSSYNFERQCQHTHQFSNLLKKKEKKNWLRERDRFDWRRRGREEGKFHSFRSNPISWLRDSSSLSFARIHAISSKSTRLRFEVSVVGFFSFSSCEIGWSCEWRGEREESRVLWSSLIGDLVRCSGDEDGERPWGWTYPYIFQSGFWRFARKQP